MVEAVEPGGRLARTRRLPGGLATATHAVDITTRGGAARQLVVKRFVPHIPRARPPRHHASTPPRPHHRRPPPRPRRGITHSLSGMNPPYGVGSCPKAPASQCFRASTPRMAWVRARKRRGGAVDDSADEAGELLGAG